MPKLTPLEELDSAIRLVASDGASEPSRQVAEELYDSDPYLIEPFTRIWVIDKLASLIRARRFKVQLENNPQMLLGFKPPKTLKLKNGEEVLFGAATLSKMKQARAVLWNEKRDYKHPAIVKMDKAIALMEQYAPTHHGVKFDEVVEREAGKKG